jgi:hypothetical protein
VREGHPVAEDAAKFRARQQERAAVRTRWQDAERESKQRKRQAVEGAASEDQSREVAA